MVFRKKKRRCQLQRCQLHGCYCEKNGECVRCTLDRSVEENKNETQEPNSTTDDVTIHENESQDTETELMDYEPIAHRTRSYVNRDVRLEENLGTVVNEDKDRFVTSSMRNTSIHDEDYIHCDNCRRYSKQRDYGRNDQLRLELVQSADVHPRKKYSFLDSGRTQFLLCMECHKYLSGVGSDFDQWQYVWPSWVWKTLSADFLIDGVGEFAWSMIPMSWRHWWYPALRGTALSEGDIDMHSPESLFKDCTADLKHTTEVKSRNKLSELMDHYNKHCYCDIRCPWGCTDFLEDCGGVAFDKVLKHYLDICLEIASSSVGGIKEDTKYKHVRVKHKSVQRDFLEGARPDFFTEEHNVLYNPEWHVHRGIVMVDGKGPMVLTCKYHDGGSFLQYLHPAVNPAVDALPAKHSDQLAHAVLVPRTVKVMKRHNFSDSYQMNRIQGGFDGLDSCDVTETGRFDFLSFLSGENEWLQLRYRPDLRGKLDQLVATGKVEPWLRERMLEKSHDRYVDDEDRVNKAVCGGTFVGIEDCMKLVHSVGSEHHSVNIERNNVTGQVEERMFKPKWPSSLVWCHELDDRGHSFPKLHQLRHGKSDMRLLWLLVSMFTSVNTLWENLVESVRVSNAWHGWLLLYMTQKCFSHMNQRGSLGNPYKDVPNDTEMMEMLDPEYLENGFDVEMLSLLLSSLEKTLVWEASSTMDQHGIAQFKESNVLVVYRRKIPRADASTPSYVYAGGDKDHEFELRYIFGSEGNIVDKGRWKVECCARHGGRLFPGWWCQQRGSECLECDYDPLESPIGKLWEVLVYVRSSDPNLERLRSEYLEHVGGQLNAVCASHGFPLVFSPQGNGKQCSCRSLSGDGRVACHCVSAFECPWPGCSSSICRQHMDKIKATGEQIKIYPRNDSVPCSAHGDVSKDCDVDEEEDVYVDAMDSMNDEQGDDWFDSSEGRDMENDSVSGDLKEDEDADYEFHFAEPPQVCNETNQGGTFDPGGIRIPTTDASVPAVQVSSRVETVHMHTILNNSASVLVRHGKRLMGNRGQRGFLQRIAATASIMSVPLLYPEGMIFPSIYWKGNADGSLLGALPSPLMDDEMHTARFGFAGVTEHTRARMMNPSLLCSTDPRSIFYSFDVVNNLNLRGNDTRLVLRRGFEHLIGGGNIDAGEMQGLMGSDLIDSNRTVNKLAAMIREKRPTYFYTHTCNQKQHFGVAPLREWLDKKCEETMMEFDLLTERQNEEFCESLRQSAASQLLRTWIKVGEVYMAYICNSSEQPLGKIEKFWWRWEYQDSKGNLPHIHALLWTSDDFSNPSDMRKIQDRIRCSSRDIVTDEEGRSFVAEGILSCFDEVQGVREDSRRIQVHSCAGANYRCLKRVGPGDEDLQCRSPDYGDNPHRGGYWYKEFPVNHTDATVEILERLGLIYIERSTGRVVTLDESLDAGRYMYPADYGEHFVPCNGRLFAATRSSDNLQICSVYMSSRYLAKYCSSVDQSNVVNLRATKEGGIEMVPEQLHNTKITGSAIEESKRAARLKTKKTVTGRSVALTEMISLLLGVPQIHTNQEFVHVSTVPLEERPALYIPQRKKLPLDDIIDLDDLVQGGHLKVVEARRNLSPWRQFTGSQMMLIADQMYSPLSIDGITAFGVRPPELLCIKSPCDYLRWFSRQSHKADKVTIVNGEETKVCTTEQLVHSDLTRSAWVDGMDCQVLIRQSAFEQVLTTVDGMDDELRRLLKHLKLLSSGTVHGSEDELAMMCHFVDQRYTSKFVPLPVFSGVKPSQSQRFLVHILMSMGKFVCEYDLYRGRNMSDYFFNAGLLPRQPTDDNPPTQAEVDVIIRSYILNQLMFLPAGTKSFDRYCEISSEVLSNALIHGEMTLVGTPAYLYTSLTEAATEDCFSFREELRRSTVEAVVSTVRHCPTSGEVRDATKENPLSWRPEVVRLIGQSDASYEEEQTAFQLVMDGVDSYCSCLRSCTKNVMIAGGPGSGKTYCMQVGALYAMSRGLNTVITALQAGRAQVFGSHHIHLLMKIPPREHSNVQRLADLSIIALNRNPTHMFLLRTLDCLCVDELGLNSAEFLAVWDIVLRNIRGSSQFMGGVLLLCTIDNEQMTPIKGHPVLMSPHIITSFRVVLMEHWVRSRFDRNLQRINQIARMHHPELSDLEELKELIVSKCEHVQDWNSPKITSDMLRVFGKRQAVADAENKVLVSLQQQGMVIRYRKSEDEECAARSHGDWRHASMASQSILDKKVRERQNLPFYQNEVIEMTYNNPGHWCQGQMGMICDVPSQEELDSWDPVKVFIAPVGQKILPSGTLTKALLRRHNWKEYTVTKTVPSRNEPLGMGLLGRRIQYGIRPRIGSTVHKVMGSDVGKLVSSVSGHSMYSLWERGQVVVILSRTNYAKHMMFVGNPNETAAGLIEILRRPQQYGEYTAMVIDRLGIRGQTENARRMRSSVGIADIDLSVLHFRPTEVGLPTDPVGYAYMLLSLRNKTTVYIGSTIDLQRRLEQHNSGIGGIQTADRRLRPWAVFGYVTGFEGNVHLMRSFETQWQCAVRGTGGDALPPEGCLDVARRVIEGREKRGLGTKLKLIRCGVVVR